MYLLILRTPYRVKSHVAPYPQNTVQSKSASIVNLMFKTAVPFCDIATVLRSSRRIALDGVRWRMPLRKPKRSAGTVRFPFARGETMSKEQGACILDLMKWIFQATEFYHFNFERSARNSLMLINFIDSTLTMKRAHFKEEVVKSWLDTLIRVTLPLWWHQGNCTASPITTSNAFAFYTLLPKRMLVVVVLVLQRLHASRQV